MPQKDDGLARIAKSPELQKLIPADYIEFRKQWDESQHQRKERVERIRGFKAGKDQDKSRLLELKKKIKMPKTERMQQRKFIKSIQNRIKGLNRKIKTRGKGTGAAGAAGGPGRPGRNKRS